MVFALALVGSIFWAAIMYAVFYARQTPEAKVRKRIMAMIESAESERARLKRVRNAYKPPEKPDVASRRSFYRRIVKPALDALEAFLHSLTPHAIIGMLENKIFRAGKQNIWTVQRLAAFWVLSVIFFTFVGFVIATQTDYFVTQKFLIVIAGGAFGAYFPFLMLNRQIKNRQKLLRRQLPEFLDLLCVSVQAGLSFDGAVAKITGRMKGELSEEFRRMQDDIKFGMVKAYALNQMAKRCDIEEIYLFTTSVIQAEKLGTSMSQTLETQAENIRERRRQYIRAEALKAPVKMIFPMVMFIFPSIFIVLLMPSILIMIKNFGVMD
ncbi:MAG: type II secretion system F family protein [Selenomonadaceae bacterium]|nr:type II secretion system F family protein [Selenomonadaceae bacterium]